MNQTVPVHHSKVENNRHRSAENKGVPDSTVLHILDHSYPVMSGYAIRSRSLISAQKAIGEPILALTGPLHQLDDRSAENILLDDVWYLRTPICSHLSRTALQKRWPFVREHEVVQLLSNRILEVGRERPLRLIYAHSPALCGLAGLKAARKLKIPFIYEIRAFWEDASNPEATVPSFKARLTRKLETYVAQRADAVAAIANPMLEDLRARGIRSEKLHHTPNGVNIARFSPAGRDHTLAMELGIADRLVFGFFGSLYKYEGISWLIGALAQLRRDQKQFVVLIIGRGEDRQAIAKAIQEHGAGDYVRALDYVPHEEIGRYYSLVDIAVYPRLSYRLTELVTPLKPLEAMALRKSVLASSVGGIKELVADEQTGLLFEPGNVDDFCQQANRLILSPALRLKLGNSGREFVERERDWAILAERYQKMYQSVLRGHSQSFEN